MRVLSQSQTVIQAAHTDALLVGWFVDMPLHVLSPMMHMRPLLPLQAVMQAAHTDTLCVGNDLGNSSVVNCFQPLK